MSKRSKALRYYRSYKPRSPLRKLFLFLLRLIAVVFVLYQIVNIFFIQVYTHKNQKGETERYIASPLIYGPELPLFNYRFPALRAPGRGDLVTAEYNPDSSSSWYADILNSVSRFFTFNRLSLFDDRNPYYGSRYQLFRVVGVPGDTVKLNNFRVKIQPSDRNYFIDEFEAIRNEYEIQIPEQSDSVSAELPFSGNQPEIILQEGEYLLVPDNRTGLGASVHWKSTGFSRIKARVMLTFWPAFTLL
ncbi:MAG: S26 family signal peptidase [Sediminispirochaetaceae bacterium]